MRICSCCDTSAYTLNAMPLKDRIESTMNLGMKNILSEPKCENLTPEGLELVLWCVDFLLYNKNNDYDTKLSIWEFIYGFLGFEKNSGYDYWLMCYLEHLGIMEHGCGIRCGWFCSNESNPYFNRSLSDDRKNKILKWSESFSDEN